MVTGQIGQLKAADGLYQRLNCSKRICIGLISFIEFTNNTNARVIIRVPITNAMKQDAGAELFAGAEPLFGFSISASVFG